MTALAFVVLSLAAYRAARAVALDTITEPVREWFDDRAGRSVWWAKAAELVSCGYCSGFWLSGITYFTYVAVTGRWDDEPVLVHLILWWAVAGAQSLLIAFDSFLLREAPPH